MSAREKLINRSHTKPFSRKGSSGWAYARERRGAIEIATSTKALEGLGLEGDRRCNGSYGSARQVSLISQEHIEVVAKLLGLSKYRSGLIKA